MGLEEDEEVEHFLKDQNSKKIQFVCVTLLALNITWRQTRLREITGKNTGVSLLLNSSSKRQ